MVLKTGRIGNSSDVADTLTSQGLESGAEEPKDAGAGVPLAADGEDAGREDASSGVLESKESELDQPDRDPAHATARIVHWNQQDGIFTIQIGSSTDKTLVINELARRAAMAANPDERKAATQILTAYLHQSSEVIKQAAEAGKLEGPEPLGNKEMDSANFAATTGTKAIQKATKEAATLKEPMLRRSVVYTEPDGDEGVAGALKKGVGGDAMAGATQKDAGNDTATNHPGEAMPAVDEEE